jgi:hypothetical protein
VRALLLVDLQQGFNDPKRGARDTPGTEEAATALYGAFATLLPSCELIR